MTSPGARPARKAVIPVAGMGTRFLPATKAVPKELLPVVDRPALQYIVEEAARAGLPEVLMVTGRNKGAIEDFFDSTPELETALEKKGDAARLDAVRSSTDVAQVHFVRQGEARGLGHAVLQAAAFVGDEPFAVLLGDDLIDERDHLLEQMLAVQAEHGGSVIALLDVGMENIDKYGAVAVEPGSQPALDGDEVVAVTGLVEKPPVEEAPSSLAIIGRYVLAPEVFAVLRETEPGRGGEIQADRRAGHPRGPRRAGPRRRVQRPPVRHRRQAGLPQGGRPPRRRARRPGPRAALLAARVRRRAARRGRVAGLTGAPRGHHRTAGFRAGPRSGPAVPRGAGAAERRTARRNGW
ncbi:UTP--glucose-1-phosphate uridylyltransferase [Blastococcus sp. TML/C7B]|uniref:UTP--glucose-1-phosphate uridylyltransferase n=1 Tax=Blastococcus sp. TML/C7B TaxID=2798728 RepID=UPI001F5B138D|nr:UTP--glucose-1-phosphate uridylyltransferase [Blastococcus sp. TML/C7B]